MKARRRGFLGAAGSLVLALAAPAAPAPAADSWPVAGGNPSRSGFDAADGGEAPWTALWQRDAGVRNAPIITGGGGPSVQRVAYATEVGNDVLAHLQVLETGLPVGPEAGIKIDDGGTFAPGAAGTDTGSVAFADTSTSGRLGQLLVVHNDDAAVVGAGVFLQRIDLTTGAPSADEVVSGSGPTPGCRINGSPVLTPPNATGGRVLFFTMSGTCTQGTSLVRVPIEGDAVLPNAPFGTQTFVPLVGLNERASVSLVVLTDPATNQPTFYVAVPRDGAVDFYDANEPLSATSTPEISAALPAGEQPQTVSAPASAAGLIAGSDGSGTPAAPWVYVATAVADATRVYRLKQAGATMNADPPTPKDIPSSGLPAPALAVAESVGPSGVLAGGRLVVSSAANLTVLRASDLTITAQLHAQGKPPGPGEGFGRTVPSVSGDYVYVARDGAADVPGRHLVRRLADLEASSFAEAAASAAVKGPAWGAPAIARGFSVFGSSAGAITYRNADVTPPAVELVAPGPGATVAGAVDLAARASDARGVVSVEFRLSTESSTIVLGRDSTPETSTFATRPGEGGRFTLAFQTGSVQNGDYSLDAIATDESGRTAATPRRRIRIANRTNGVDGLPPGACATERRGTPAADVLTGSPFGDRLLGGAGDDRLAGLGGHDCLYGEAGADSLDGGPGDDLLEGGAGNDKVVGGTGRDRISGGAGNDRLRGDADDDRISGGAGKDQLFGGRGSDRLLGGDGNDTLRGEDGNDTLDGGRGNDVIVAGKGSHSIIGGAGNDRIHSVNSRRDTVTCGSGRDIVIADRRDRVSSKCERVRRVGR